MLWTGMPLSSSTRSPVCMEGSRSGLRTAESNLRENYSEWMLQSRGVRQKTSWGWSDFEFIRLMKYKLHTCVKFWDSPRDSDKRAFLLTDVSGHSKSSLTTCTWRERHQRHHVGTLGEWRRWPHSGHWTLTETVATELTKEIEERTLIRIKNLFNQKTILLLFYQLSARNLPVEFGAFDERVGVSVTNEHFTAHTSEAFRVVLLLSSYLFVRNTMQRPRE